MRKRILLIAIILIGSVVADQVTKAWARKELRGNAPVVVVKNYLALEYHENPGVAFGLAGSLPGGRYLFIAIGIAVLFLVWRIVRQHGGKGRWPDLAFALVAGGALGNLIDRVVLGRVVDFVVMHWHRKIQWPAYNVADAALVVGIGILLIVLGKKRSSA